MAEKKEGIDWTTLWKKDDWMSVWIGFLILIIFMAGATLKLPGWRWMTDAAVHGKVPAGSVRWTVPRKGRGDKGRRRAKDSEQRP